MITAILVVVMLRGGPMPETYTYQMYDLGSCTGLRDYIKDSPLIVLAECYPKK
jgi:hypothetical protein